MTPRIDALFDDEGWAGIDADCEALAVQAATMALEGAGIDQDIEISVLLTDDARVAELNSAFRGKNTPTNVLSWPAFDLSPAEEGVAPPSPPASESGAPSFLGDVALARETVLAEAQAQGKTPAEHATHLILHAVLHLLGYDHETDADARLMEGIETAAFLRAGLPDPYMERTAGSADRNG